MQFDTLSRELVEQSAVLLKNDGDLLPFAAGRRLAVFGWAQCAPVLSGSGSGAVRTEATDLCTTLRAVGLQPVESLAAYYAAQDAIRRENAPPEFDFSLLGHTENSGLMYEVFGKYRPNPAEYLIPADLLRQAAAETDTALWLLGRQSGGEECDRHLADDYFLSDAERALLSQLTATFAHVAVVLNINGVLNLAWTEDAAIESVLYLGVPGQSGMAALANLLCGAAEPSGKLSFTVARRAEDNPAWADFSWDKTHPEKILTYESYGLTPPPTARDCAHHPVTVCTEDIYVGYRGFEAFGLAPLYPFGHGLTYTCFAVQDTRIEKYTDGVRVTAAVCNTGAHPGREVLQLYVAARGTALPQPVKTLRGFAKTPRLQPGESCTVAIVLPWRELASYDEARAAWVIERGQYQLRLGTSSASTALIGAAEAASDIVVEPVESRLTLDPAHREKLTFCRTARTASEALPAGCPILTLTAADILPRAQRTASFVDCSALSDRQLAALLVGYGPGIPFSAFLKVPAPDTLTDADGAPLTGNDHPEGVRGYVSPAIPAAGIHSVFYKDGPAGIGQTAWPGEMLLACSFDAALLRRFGDAVAQECEAAQVDIWLAPALNLHRHPLGGRNFEYFSEDPCLTGVCAVAVLQGLQQGHRVLACAKHFAANEQETYRRGSAKDEGGRPAFDAVDTIVSERALREVYLKPFEMAVRDGGLRCIMTSFNRINGTFAGGSRDLCTGILREEWGFDGFVVTDWGDMDIVVDGADAVAAGNDVIMPGGPPVAEQILRGLAEGRVTREELERAASNLCAVVKTLR